MKRSTWRQNSPLIILVLVVVGLVIAVKLLPADSALGRNARFLWVIVPSAIALWEYSYARVRGHRLLVQRIRMMLLNPECAWSMTAEYETQITRSAAGQALEQVGPRSASDVRILSASSDRVVYQAEAMTIVLAWEATTDPFDDAHVVNVEVPESRHSYRRWKSVIGESVPALLENVDRDLEPSARKYSARVSFDNANPYFGLFATGPAVDEVVRFQLEQHVRWKGSTVVVTVDRSGISLVSDSFEAIRALSLRYLAVREVGGD